jgi:hypothetical protein
MYTLSYHERDSNDMESKIETNLLAQILIKGNLNINSILYKQHNFIYIVESDIKHHNTPPNPTLRVKVSVLPITILICFLKHVQWKQPKY